MTSDRPAEYLVSLVHELCKLPRETEWVEFKVKDAEPQTIGEYLSALANAAALTGKAFAYLVWGVRDKDHTVVGTAFAPRAARVGNEELENWLLRLLEPKIDSAFARNAVAGSTRSSSRWSCSSSRPRSSRRPRGSRGPCFSRIGHSPRWTRRTGYGRATSTPACAT